MASELISRLLRPIDYATGRYRTRWKRQGEANPFVVALFYHRVSPEAGDIKLGEVEAVSPDLFEKQMRFFLSAFDPVSPSQAADRVGLPKRSFTVTFDDGYEDNLTHAAPIMKRLGVKGGVYVNSGYIGTDRLYWWERLGRLITDSPRPKVDLNTVLPAIGGTALANGGCRLDGKRNQTATYQKLQSVLNQARADEIDRHLQTLAGFFDSGLAHEGRDAKMMTWSQVAQAAEMGLEIGAHTVDHCSTGKLDDAGLEHQIGQNCDDIHRKVGTRPVTFAYPYGKPQHIHKRAGDVLKRHGIRGAFTTSAGVIGEGQCPWHLPRIGVYTSNPIKWVHRVSRCL